MSSHPDMLNSRQVVRAIIFGILFFVFVAAHVPIAAAQNFSLSVSPFNPPAGVDPGGSATATITLTTTNGFTGTVDFTCTVSDPSDPTASNLPLCLISPTSDVPDAVLALTATTVGSAAGTYTLTISGTSGSEVETAPLIYLNVVSVPQDYTLTISKPISPGTVTAGFSAQATVTITPTGSYSGNVTLSCLSVTPVVTAAPFCSFNPQTVAVTAGASPTSVLTVNTYGTAIQTTGQLWTPPIFFGFCFAVPVLALIGVGTKGRLRKKLLGLLMLMAVGSALLLLPSCNTTYNTTSGSDNGLVTPSKPYTITLTGVDENGVAPSNITTTSTQPTITLTVN
ncbi:MAG: hypothetical protein WB919_03745 [Candidatus Sulfotelmatobacter sp.]